MIQTCEYQVVVNDALQPLQWEVNKQIQKGWELHGALFFAEGCYHQPIIRRPKLLIEMQGYAVPPNQSLGESKRWMIWLQMRDRKQGEDVQEACIATFDQARDAAEWMASVEELLRK